MEETYGLQDYSDQEPVYSVDPVCGMKVNEANAPAKTGYAGQMYYFCSADCQEKFQASPGMYIGQTR